MFYFFSACKKKSYLPKKAKSAVLFEIEGSPSLLCIKWLLSIRGEGLFWPAIM